MEDNYGNTLVTINSPEFVDRLAEIKGDKDIKWPEVAVQINKEFDLDLSPRRVSDLYNKGITREVTISRQANKKLGGFVESMGKRFGAITRTTDRFHNILKRTLDALEECEDEELLERLPDVFKAGKTVETVHKMDLAGIELIRREQDKITVTQKDGVFSDEEVKTNIYKQLPKILQLLEAQGQIRIIDRKVLTK